MSSAAGTSTVLQSDAAASGLTRRARLDRTGSAQGRTRLCRTTRQMFPSPVSHTHKEVTVKARLYRTLGSVSVVSVLVAVLGAPKKWG